MLCTIPGRLYQLLYMKTSVLILEFVLTVQLFLLQFTVQFKVKILFDLSVMNCHT